MFFVFWLFFFFFKQKTAYEMRISDWSSDVCSSDLAARTILRVLRTIGGGVHLAAWDIVFVQNLEEEVGFITARPRPDQRVELSDISHAFRIAGIPRCADEPPLADQGPEFCKQRLRLGRQQYPLSLLTGISAGPRRSGPPSAPGRCHFA